MDKEQQSVEDQQVQDFVHRVWQEPAYAAQVLADPDAELGRLGYSERVKFILKMQLLVLAGMAPLPPSWQHFK